MAIESTGVYWIPIYELLEQRGIRCFLINATHFKRVPGRKSDVQDCQWLQQCNSFGLLADSFRPDVEMVRLRTYLRHRAELIERRAPYVLHMQKALQPMNIQLDVVLSNIMGDTGQAIIRSILGGERDPVKLAQLRHPGCHSSQVSPASISSPSMASLIRWPRPFSLKSALTCPDGRHPNTSPPGSVSPRTMTFLAAEFSVPKPARPTTVQRKRFGSLLGRSFNPTPPWTLSMQSRQTGLRPRTKNRLGLT